MTVTLGFPATRITLGRILEWEESRSETLPIKYPIGDEADTQPSYYTKYPTVIEITCRLKGNERTTLYTMEAQKAWQPLIEDGSTTNVWIESIEMDYRGKEDYEHPWLTKITLLRQDN